MFLRLRRQKKIMPSTPNPTRARPPMVPPTMAPTFVFDDDDAADVVGVGVVVLLVVVRDVFAPMSGFVEAAPLGV